MIFTCSLFKCYEFPVFTMWINIKVNKVCLPMYLYHKSKCDQNYRSERSVILCPSICASLIGRGNIELSFHFWYYLILLDCLVLTRVFDTMLVKIEPYSCETWNWCRGKNELSYVWHVKTYYIMDSNSGGKRGIMVWMFFHNKKGL